jgi:hypothetical protein
MKRTAFKDQISLMGNNVMMPLAIFNKGAWCFADLRNNAPVGCFSNTQVSICKIILKAVLLKKKLDNYVLRMLWGTCFLNLMHEWI